MSEVYCYSVRRLSGLLSDRRYFYADGTRMTRFEFIRTAWHVPHSSRMETRRDGSVIVREFHAYRKGGA